MVIDRKFNLKSGNVFKGERKSGKWRVVQNSKTPFSTLAFGAVILLFSSGRSYHHMVNFKFQVSCANQHKIITTSCPEKLQVSVRYLMHLITCNVFCWIKFV